MYSIKKSIKNNILLLRHLKKKHIQSHKMPKE